VNDLVQSPFLIFTISVITLYLAAWIGAFFFKRRRALEDDERDDFSTIWTATLTLLAVIIGFSFSIAISRYEQRRDYEEAEANAIGTEYVRADLLPPADSVKVRELLKSYLTQRILFYVTENASAREPIAANTARIQMEMWSAVRVPATAQPTPVMALAVSGMNDVLNTQGYTQAAYRNRIPKGEWVLMAVIAIFANVFVGYGSRRSEREKILLLALPVIVSVSFMLIADIDSPRGGLIQVRPLNLESLAQSLQAQ
jgi:hypothetical protein